MLFLTATVLVTSYKEDKFIKPHNLLSCSSSCHSNPQKELHKNTKLFFEGKEPLKYIPNKIYDMKLIIVNNELKANKNKLALINLYSCNGKFSINNKNFYLNKGNNIQYNKYASDIMYFSSYVHLINDSAIINFKWQAPDIERSSFNMRSDILTEVFYSDCDNTLLGEEYIFQTN